MSMGDLDSHTVTESERRRVSEAEELRDRGTRSVDQLIDMLTDPSWVVRRAVVGSLAWLGEAAVEPLCSVLRHQRDNEARLAAAVDALVAASGSVEPSVLQLTGDPDPAVVADAVQILGRRRSEDSIPRLVALTKSDDDNVAVAAIEALGRIGGRAAVEALVEAIGSGSFFRVFPAIDVLGRSGDPRVVEPLAGLLSNPSYVFEATRALGRAGERAGVKPLLALLSSSSDAVVRLAAVALWELRERFSDKSGGAAEVIDELVRDHVGPGIVRRLTRVMGNTDAPEAVAVCNLLGVTGSAEAAPILATMLDAAGPTAACAAAALKRIGREADGHLQQALREGTSARRKILLPVVTRSWAALDVAECSSDPDPEVRALACDTLARLGNTSVVPQLFALLDDGNSRVVHSATAAIQALGTREGRELAVAAARSPNPIVRRSALRILAYFGDNRALQPILEALNDQDARVREAALQGLPYLEDKRALDALFQASKSEDRRTRAVAMRSLGYVPKGNERVYSLLLKGLADEEPWVRYYACQSLGRQAYGPAAHALGERLADAAGQVRVAAVEALSHLDSGEAHDALRRASASSDVEVKRAALLGLGMVQRSGDLPLLLSAASSPDTPTRLMALSAIANFPSPVVIGALSSAATDANEQVRSAAIDFLAGRTEQAAIEVLVELLANDATRDRAKSALAVRGEGRVGGLLAALESASDELAPLLISSLATIERPDARAGLLSAIKLNNPAARKAAASGLAARRDPESVAALRDAADNDPDPEVRKICALLLSE